VAFDAAGAKKAGYSDAEIADYLGQQSKFDVAGARKAGYSDTEIVQHLSPPAPTKPAKKSSLWDQVGAFAQSATEQIPFLDEAAAGVVALGTGRPYKEVRQVQNSLAAQDRVERPLARNAGGVAGFGVGLAAPGAGYVRGANSLAQATVRSAQVGAGLGALYGAGSAQDGLGNRAKGAAVGGASGAVLGAALPAAVGAVRAIPGAARRAGSAAVATGQQVAQNFGHEVPEAAVTPQAQKRALDYVADLAAKAKVTPEQMEAHPGLAVGEPVTTAEALGRTGVAQATALARRTGTTGDIADGMFTNRAEGAPDRLLGHLSSVAKVTPEGAQGGIDAIVDAGRKRAKPLFDAALASPDPVWNPDLADLVKNRPVIRKAIGHVIDDLKNAGKDPTALEAILKTETAPRQVQPGRTIASPPTTTTTTVGVPRPTAEAWDAVKKAISRQIERNPITGKPLPDTQSQGNFGVAAAERALTDALKTHIPGYAEALATSGDYLSVQGAFQRTSGSLFSTKTTPAQFEKLWQSWKSPAEMSAAKDALAAEIFNKAQNGQLRPGRLLVPAVRQKLATAFGQDAADEIIRRVQIQAKLAATGNRIRPGVNSTTAEATMAGGEMDNALGDGAMRAGGHLLAGRPFKAAGALVNALAAPVRGAVTPIDQATRNEVGRILMQSPEETAAMLRSRNVPARNSNPLARR